MSICGLGYVAVNVSDMDAWLDLMTSVFGVELIAREDGTAVDIRLDDWHHRMTLYKSGEDGIAAIGWELANEKDLEAMSQALRDYGVKVTPASPQLLDQRKVTGLYQFMDPASNMPSEIFYGAQHEMLPFRPSLGISGYNTGDLGLGHVVYFVGDYAESHRFYTEVMGFRTSDHIIWDEGEKDATFYHCNPRHHSLAIMPPFGDIPPGTFNHLMLEANSLSDVGRAYDVVLDKKMPVMMGLGKHTNDLTESFYLITPSGFGLELGCNGQLIGDGWRVKTHDSPMLWGHREPED
ncbi:MAG: 2,3-dihydroxybiphenyl 1,2-dioxygenase [Halieaceae bacterium]|jgi:2,3-dihydroxybiphenyl 1,2-dioxygenase